MKKKTFDLAPQFHGLLSPAGKAGSFEHHRFEARIWEMIPGVLGEKKPNMED